MNKFVLATAAAALLVSMPVSGAFARSHGGGVPNHDGASDSVDMMTTGSIGTPAMPQNSYASMLETRIVAEQSNLTDLNSAPGAANPAADGQAQVDLVFRRAGSGR